jgi:hypothetical protein
MLAHVASVSGLLFAVASLSSTAQAATRSADTDIDDLVTVCTVMGDVDVSGSVDVRDYLGVLSAYGTTDVTYDVDGDGLVGSSDLMEVLTAFGSSVDEDLCRGLVRIPTNYYLYATSIYTEEDTGLVAVRLDAYWRNSIRNMEVCYGPAGTSAGDLCDEDAGGNALPITDGQGNDYAWVDEAEAMAIGNKWGHTIDLTPDVLLGAGLEPFECGGEYRIRLRNGAFYDEVYFEQHCPPPPPPPEVCTDCPFGGWYDGANCQVGTAPEGTSAGHNAHLDAWTYAPDEGGCDWGDPQLRDGSCLYEYVPEGADGWALPLDTNGWYYFPVCD